jgi:hypothetical protein
MKTTIRPFGYDIRLGETKLRSGKKQHIYTLWHGHKYLGACHTLLEANAFIMAQIAITKNNEISKQMKPKNGSDSRKLSSSGSVQLANGHGESSRELAYGMTQDGLEVR